MCQLPHVSAVGIAEKNAPSFAVGLREGDSFSVRRDAGVTLLGVGASSQVDCVAGYCGDKAVKGAKGRAAFRMKINEIKSFLHTKQESLIYRYAEVS